MVRIKLDQNIFGISNIIERATGARVKDCFLGEEEIYVIVARSEMGKILGKSGENIKKLQIKFEKKFKVVEFNDDVQLFVANFIQPLKVEEITQDENAVIIRDANRKTKSLLIGRGGKNLNMLKRSVTRFFSVDVRVE